MPRAKSDSTTPASNSHFSDADADALLDEIYAHANATNRLAIDALDALEDPDKDMLKKRLGEEIAAHDNMGAATIACQRREGIRTRRVISNVLYDTAATRTMVSDLLRRDDDRRRREKEREEDSRLMSRVFVVLIVVGAFILGRMWPVV